MMMLGPSGSRGGGEKWFCPGHIEGKDNKMSSQIGNKCISSYYCYKEAPHT